MLSVRASGLSAKAAAEVITTAQTMRAGPSRAPFALFTTAVAQDERQRASLANSRRTPIPEHREALRWATCGTRIRKAAASTGTDSRTSGGDSVSLQHPFGTARTHRGW